MVVNWQVADAEVRKLLDAAAQVREQAYAPYSHYAVGAVALLADGTIVTGCNVENASFGLSICAERVAIQTAIAGGSLQPDAGQCASAERQVSHGIQTMVIVAAGPIM